MAGVIGTATKNKVGLMSSDGAIKTNRFLSTNGSVFSLCTFNSSYQTLLINGTENTRGKIFEIAFITASSTIPQKIGSLPEGIHVYRAGSTVLIKTDASFHIEFSVICLSGQDYIFTKVDSLPSDAIEL